MHAHYLQVYWQHYHQWDHYRSGMRSSVQRLKFEFMAMKEILSKLWRALIVNWIKILTHNNLHHFIILYVYKDRNNELHRMSWFYICLHREGILIPYNLAINYSNITTFQNQSAVTFPFSYSVQPSFRVSHAPSKCILSTIDSINLMHNNNNIVNNNIIILIK